MREDDVPGQQKRIEPERPINRYRRAIHDNILAIVGVVHFRDHRIVGESYRLRVGPTEVHEPGGEYKHDGKRAAGPAVDRKQVCFHRDAFAESRPLSQAMAENSRRNFSNFTANHF